MKKVQKSSSCIYSMSHLVHLKFQFSSPVEQVRQAKCAPADLCFIDGYKMKQKLLKLKSYLVLLYSVVCQYEDFCHVILHGSHFQGTWSEQSKNQRATTLKLVMSILDGRQRIQSPSGPWFLFAYCLSKTKIESQPDIFLFPLFLKPRIRTLLHAVKTKLRVCFGDSGGEA